jgi:hypothetical protein
VLSNQPQGGFITRKPTADVLVASDDDGFGGFFRSWEPQTPNQTGYQTGYQNGYQNGNPAGNPRRRGGQPTPQVQQQPYQPMQPRWW